VPIQATGLCDLHDPTELGSVHRSRRRAVHGQRTVTAPAVVVHEIVTEERPQVPFVNNDHVVQALAANAADHSLCEGILPGTPRCSEDLFYPQALDALLERGAVHAVAIPDQAARRRLPRERLAELLGGPLRGRVLRDVEMRLFTESNAGFTR